MRSLIVVCGLSLVCLCVVGCKRTEQPRKSVTATPERPKPQEALKPQKESNAAAEEEGSDKTARYVGREFAIKFLPATLKSPTTATFPHKSECSVSELESVTDATGAQMKRWRVTGPVDSQNSFGAMIRSNWEAIVGHTNDGYLGCQLKHEGRVVFELEGYSKLVAGPTAKEVKQIEQAKQVEKRKQATAERQAQPLDLEKAAAGKLTLAKTFLNKGDTATGKRWLTKVIDEFPGTEAAQEAATLLSRIPKP